MKRALLLSCALGTFAACDAPSTPLRAQATAPDAKGEVDASPVAPAPVASKTGAPRSPRMKPRRVQVPPKPDDASTAKLGPKAADLARYTGDLGEGKLMARIVTSMGGLTCELYEKDAPMTVANFVGLARGLKAWVHPATKKEMVGVSLYEGVTFHRVIPNFVIQAGDPVGTGLGGPGYTFDNENNEHKYDKPGVLAMANSGPSSNGSQFFVTESALPHLDGKFTIFGQCDNLTLVREMARVPVVVTEKAWLKVPVTPVVLKTVVISRQPSSPREHGKP